MQQPHLELSHVKAGPICHLLSTLSASNSLQKQGLSALVGQTEALTFSILQCFSCRLGTLTYSVVVAFKGSFNCDGILYSLVVRGYGSYWLAETQGLGPPGMQGFFWYGFSVATQLATVSVLCWVFLDSLDYAVLFCRQV